LRELAQKKALIMAGGTGGHIMPGLEIANALKKDDYKVAWLGSKAGLEFKLVPKHNIDLYCMPITGLRGKKWTQKLLSPFRVVVSIMYSIYVLLKFKPSFVLGMGGFASGPGGIAAWMLRIPLIIHEQNSVLCMTNKILRRFSAKMLISFPDLEITKNSFKYPVVYTGNPVRSEILQLAEPKERWQTRVGALRVLVLGGSRGALILNNTVPKAIATLPVSQRPDIWHQSGADNYDLTVDNYIKSGLKAKVDAFIDDMAQAYAWADLVIARAGALTIAELSAAGLPSVLIPYPHATDDHQKLNAVYLVKNHAAVMINQNDLDFESLANTLLELIHSRSKLLDMANCARGLSEKNATLNVIRNCEEVSMHA